MGKLVRRIDYHQLAVKRHDKFSLESIHEGQRGHLYDGINVSILGCGNIKKAVNSSSFCFSTEGAIHKHIGLNPMYE